MTCPTCDRPPADESRAATLGPDQSCACGIGRVTPATEPAPRRIDWLRLDGGAAWPRGVDVAEAIHEAAYRPGGPSQWALAVLRSAAETYLHIVEHPVGTEAILRQVRQARRLNSQTQEGDND